MMLPTNHAANRRSRTSHQGFTLVEVMVTMAVIGMLALTVSFVVPDKQDDEAADNARVLYERIRYAREYALVRHAILGLRIDDGNSYRFLQFTDGRWQDITHRGLRRTDLSTDIELTVEAGDLELLQQDDTELDEVFAVDREDRGTRSDDDKPASEPTPQLFIFGSGDLPPFELFVRHVGLLGEPVSWRIASTDGVDIVLEREN
ncbi:GspH/FimT family pseudopilin [Pseudidiomarina marina]|uniref:Tfp pilus assembly protein FimT/FimU n=1 Tax=Pseudidiomarina marina TaxID=502366 RepID=UPI003850E04C